MDQNILFAFTLTLLAGLSTGIGGLIGILIKRQNISLLSFGLGFSAGVMVYVSFIEIFDKSQASLIDFLGEGWGKWATIIALFSGIGIAALIDTFIPERINHHTKYIPGTEEHNENIKQSSLKLARTGVFTALAIAIHNFPEGLATFMSAIYNPALGVSIAIAIAIHNIPEGICIALPVYYATGSRKKAFYYSFLSGLTEPVGAIIGFFLLKSIFNGLTFGMIFGAVAGIMIYISFDELLPLAREYGKEHMEILGLFSGMAVMAVSLLLF